MSALISDSNKSYIKAVIRDLILGMEEPFSINDIMTMAEQHGISEEKIIKSVIIELCDSGFVNHVDDLFYFNKSMVLYT